MVWKKPIILDKKLTYTFPLFKTLINYNPSPNTLYFRINYLLGLGLAVRTGVLTAPFFLIRIQKPYSFITRTLTYTLSSPNTPTHINQHTPTHTNTNNVTNTRFSIFCRPKSPTRGSSRSSRALNRLANKTINMGYRHYLDGQSKNRRQKPWPFLLNPAPAKATKRFDNGRFH